MTDNRRSQIQDVSILSGQHNQQICVCYDVYSDEMIEAIQNGADTVKKISDLTYACQGCGSCRLKIEALLEDANILSLE